MNLSNFYKKPPQPVANCVLCGGHVQRRLLSWRGVCPTCEGYALVAVVTTRFKDLFK